VCVCVRVCVIVIGWFLYVTGSDMLSCGVLLPSRTINKSDPKSKIIFSYKILVMHLIKIKQSNNKNCIHILKKKILNHNISSKFK